MASPQGNRIEMAISAGGDAGDVQDRSIRVETGPAENAAMETAGLHNKQRIPLQKQDLRQALAVMRMRRIHRFSKNRRRHRQ
jgi:predicted protein tyrosine phosphatase